MALAPPLTLQLTQTKVFTGPYKVPPFNGPFTERFAVQSKIVPSAATVSSLEAAFIIGSATGVDRERLIRIVDLDDPADQALVNNPATVNPLLYFRDQVLDLAELAFAGDVLRVITPPGEWSTDGLNHTTKDYVIADVDYPNARLLMAEPFLWSAQAVWYTVLSPDLITPRTGFGETGGLTERENIGLPEWRDSQFTAGFPTAPEALAHIASVQAYVASLGLQVKVDIAEYLADGGNPIINTY